mgnify:FL=1
MLCGLCGKKVKTRKTILNLFDPEIHHICEKCYSRNPLIPRISVIPIENGEIYHHSMIRGDEHGLGPAYMSFIKVHLKHYLKEYKDCAFLYYDQVTHDTIKVLDLLKLGSIYLLTLYENIEEGEKL